jgi:hypothetical protein
MGTGRADTDLEQVKNAQAHLALPTRLASQQVSDGKFN